MKNRIIMLILALSLVLTFAACGGADPELPPRDRDREEAVPAIANQPDPSDNETDTEAPADTDPPNDNGTDEPTEPQDPDPAPEADPNATDLEELVREYAKINLPRTAGIVDNIAFWTISQSPNIANLVLYDLNTKEVITISNFSTNTIRGWNGYVYGRNAYYVNRGANYKLQCFDLKGNLIHEYSFMSERGHIVAEGYTLLSNGTIVIYDGGGVVRDVISADNFSSTLKTPITLTFDIGHGRTQEITDFEFAFEYNNVSIPFVDKFASRVKLNYTDCIICE